MRLRGELHATKLQLEAAEERESSGRQAAAPPSQVEQQTLQGLRDVKSYLAFLKKEIETITHSAGPNGRICTCQYSPLTSDFAKLCRN